MLYFRTAHPSHQLWAGANEAPLPLKPNSCFMRFEIRCPELRLGERSHRDPICLVVLRCGFESPSPDPPRASPATTRPRGDDPCPWGVSAGMLATCSLPLDSRSALEAPDEHLADAGSHRGTFCRGARSDRYPHGASRSVGGGARHHQPAGGLVCSIFCANLARGT